MKRFLTGSLWRRIGLSCAATAVVLPQTLSAQEPAAAADPVADKVTELVDEVISAEVELQVSLKRSKILRMKQDIYRTAIADPNVLDFVAFGNREVELIGKQTGTTTVTLWTGTEQNPRVLSMLVTVTRDESIDDHKRIEFGELNAQINEMFPNSRIQLIPIADKVIVRGEAMDELEASKIVSIVTQQGGLGAAGAGARANIYSAGSAARQEGTPQEQRIQIINLIRVPGVKQVLLKVRVAELKRSAGRELGADLDVEAGTDLNNVKDFILGASLSGGSNISTVGTFNDVSFELTLKALLKNGTAKILAEPNLVTLSGQQASFLAGGEFPVPTVVGVGGAQAATTSFKGFGTQLNFTPTVLDHDRIRLQVSPTFSSLNRTNQVNGIFGLDTRTVDTTVEMREGQVLAIAGLLQTQQRGDREGLPLLGNVPGLNVLTSNKSVSSEETELLILITPELVQPLEPDQIPALMPGMEVTEPNDLDFFLFGDIEGRPDGHHRSTVWQHYQSKMKRCQKNSSIKQSTEYFFNGLHGFAD